MSTDVPLVGREQELAQIAAVADEVVAGRGRLLAVGGPAGVGKSRLVAAALQHQQAKGFRVLRGRCLPQATTPYLPIFEALRSGGLSHLLTVERPPRLEYLYLATPHGLELASAGRTDSGLDREIFLSMLSAVESFVTESMGALTGRPGQRLNALGYGQWRVLLLARPWGRLVAVLQGTETTELLEALEGVLDSVWATSGATLQSWDGDRATVEGLRVPLEQLLRSGRFDGGDQLVDPRDRAVLVLEGLVGGLSRALEEGPITLQLEDAHLADSATLQTLVHLSRSMSTRCLLICLTFRDEAIATSDHPHALAVHLDLLQEEGRAVRLDVRPLDLAQTAQLACVLCSAESLEGVLSTLLFERTGGLPLFVEEVVGALRREGRLVVIGGVARLQGVVGSEAIPAQLQQTIAARLQTLPSAQRELLECAAVEGEVFGPATLARVLQHTPLQVLRTLRALELEHRLVTFEGEKAAFAHGRVRDVLYDSLPAPLRRQYHGAIADSLMEQGTATITERPELIAHHLWAARDPRAREFVLNAAQRAFSMSSFVEAAGWFDRYATIAKEPMPEVLLQAFGQSLWCAGGWDRAIAVFDELLARFPDSKERGLYDLQRLDSQSARDGFEKILPQVLARKPQGRGLPWARWVVLYSRYALRVGAGGTVQQEMREALEELERNDLPPVELGWAYSTYALMLEMLGDFDGCALYGRKAQQLAGGDPILYWMSCNNIGAGCLLGGRLQEAAPALEQAREISERTVNLFGSALSYNNLGLLAIRRGDLQVARERLLQGLRGAERIESKFLMAMALDLLGLAAIESGRLAQAAEFLDRSEELVSFAADSGELTWLAIHRGQLALANGAIDAARSCAEKALQIAQTSHDTPSIALSMALLGSAFAASGQIDLAEASFSPAAMMLEGSAARFEAAEVQLWWGRALAGLGDHKGARVHLDRAVERFATMGAQGRFDLAQRLLEQGKAATTG